MVCDKCEVAIVVFDLNNLDTLTEANNIIDLIKKKVDGYPTQFLLAGNKVHVNCLHLCVYNLKHYCACVQHLNVYICALLVIYCTAV